MVFAYLRSCYTTKARMLRGSDRESTIRWYFAPEGAEHFTDRQSFEPLSWSGGSPAGNQIGEVIGAPRPWSNGATPDCATGASFWAGNADWFRFGVPELLPEPKELNECGLPVACPAAALCQSYVANFEGATASAEWTEAGTWTVVNWTVDIIVFQLGESIDDFLAFVNDGSTACHGFPRMGFFVGNLAAFPGLVGAELLAYDTETFEGTWQLLDADGPIEGVLFFATLTPP